MGLLEKLIIEGWWDSSLRPEVKIDSSSISQQEIDELWEKKRLIFFDRVSGNTYAITIPIGVKAEDLKILKLWTSLVVFIKGSSPESDAAADFFNNLIIHTTRGSPQPPVIAPVINSQQQRPEIPQ